MVTDFGHLPKFVERKIGDMLSIIERREREREREREILLR